MRLTVGPLPPAVYWRRRAVVLGALSLVLFLLFYSCAGTHRSDAANNTSGRAGASSTPTPTVASSLLHPTVEGPSTSRSPAGAEPTATVGAGADSGSCTDAEVTVTVSTDGNKTEFAQGTYVRIYLKIKNISTRTCSRDVGATQQELWIRQGAQKLWSSDDCGAGGGMDVRTLRAGEQLDQFNVTWNGRASTNCAAMPLPNPGSYQLLGRFGTRWSDPVTLTITGGK
jgi:hypothetical protein